MTTSDEQPRLPAVHALLDHPALRDLRKRHGRNVVRDTIRAVLHEARQSLTTRELSLPDSDAIADQVLIRIASSRPFLRPVINATGILLHTGLGRAPLGPEIAAHVASVAGGYSSLELDLTTGERGQRSTGVAHLLRQLTGAAAAAVVNNNAAATLIALHALAAGKDVIVSRGQLVEIGGSFRLPEVFEASGARLREVGTTNRTRLDDYARAIGPDTAAILRVHTSNYRITGFMESVEISALADLATKHGLWCIDDIGSGALTSELPPGLTGEPNIATSLAAGAHLVLCSGDKLLGGPQCGLIVGDAAAIEQIQSNPLMRAVRVDKMTLAALELLLRAARSPDCALQTVPLWSMLATSVDRLTARAERLAPQLAALGLDVSIEPSTAEIGGGSAPLHPVASVALCLSPPFPGDFPTEGSLARALRLGDPVIVSRATHGHLWLDLRTVLESQDDLLVRAIAAAFVPG